MDQLGLFIDGEFVSPPGNDHVRIANPATGEIVGEVVGAKLEDARRAIDSSHAAYQKWSAAPVNKRASVLSAAARLLRENKERIATIMTLESGKTIKESRNEVDGSASRLEFYASYSNFLRDDYVPATKGGRYGVIMRRPIGVCGAITPWNNPLQQLAGRVGAALLAGNTLVAKPASTTPMTALELAKILKQSGLPPGVLNIVTGPGSIVGEEIANNPKVRKVAVIGSTEVGKRVMELASKNLKRLTLELGGSDPMIVCDDADMEKAVAAAAAGRFRNCGQGCLTIKRLILFESIADRFVEKLVERVKQIVVGNGMREEVTMGPLHTKVQREIMEEQVRDARDMGARVLAGGQRPSGGEFVNGHFYLPTILIDEPMTSRVWTEEVFGPALPIYRAENLEGALALANASRYGLGSSIWTKDMDRARKAAERIEAGTLTVNCLAGGDFEFPHGGVKDSGLGRENGLVGLQNYFELKSVIYQPSE